jgi:cytochrome c biogenesis protein CcmG/thiol:disulfide interchange protein DsbE
MRNLIAATAVLLCTTGTLAQSRMPSVQLQTMEGKRVDTRAFVENKGKPVIVNFWATWCAPCKRELNAIAELYDEWVEKTGVRLVAVSIDDARSTARVAPYVNGQGWEYDVLLDPNGDLKRALNVNNVPHTFLINGKGEIVWQHNNYEPGDEKELYRKVLEISGK